MATEKTKTASKVITEFLEAQAERQDLNTATVDAVRELRAQDDLSKVELLRKLEEARKTAMKVSPQDSSEDADD